MHADSAGISSTDIFDRGGKPRFGTTGSGGSALRQCGIFFCLAVAAFAAGAAIEIPKASGKALGVTKGKQFSEGVVFLNGRYMPPPYVVERWGVGIRINETPVIGSVIDWSEFLKTQDGVKTTKTETVVPAEPAPVPDPVVQEPVLDDFDMSLDDLFDDAPKPKRPAKKPAPARKPRPARTTTTVTYSLDGDFVPNDASKALVAKINKVRTDINAALMGGGFVCFGDSYPRVTGDARTVELILEKLPEIQRSSETQAAFLSAIRLANLQFLTEPVCKDLFRNRRDYIKLSKRYERWKQDSEIKQLLKETVEQPLL